MKIRNSSRITAIVLALVMLLPLISIPTFAETTTDQVLWSEDFSSYKGLDQAGIDEKVKYNWRQSAKNMEVATDESDDTYLRFPIAAFITGTAMDMPFAPYCKYVGFNFQNVFSNNTSAPAYPDYSIKSYDAATNKVTIAYTPDGVPDTTVEDLVIDVTPASETEIAAGNYGSFKMPNDDRSWVLCTGYYAACAQFGDKAAVDRYAHLYFGQRTYYEANDLEVLAGTKNVGDLKSEPAGISYKDHEKVVVQYNAMIEENSAGTLNMQLNHFDNASGAGKFSQMYVELGDLDLATGKWSGGALSGVTLPIGEWVTLTFIVDLVNATVQGMYDGKIIGSVSCGTKGTGGITLSGWSVSKIKKTTPAKMSGAWLVDDVKVLTGDAVGSLLTYNNYSEDFDSYAAGDTISSVATGKFSGMPANYKVANLNGELCWELTDSINGGGVNNQNPRISHEFISADISDKWTYSVRYYIPSDTDTQIQCQIMNGATGIINGAATGFVWGDLYVIKSQDGAATLRREGGYSGYAVPYDKWFTVTMEITMSNGTFDIYVNDDLALANQTTRNCTEFISFSASTLIVAKENSAAKTWVNGSVYIDDISLSKGPCGKVAKTSFNLIDSWNTDDETDPYAYLVADISEMVDGFTKGDQFSYPAGANITLDADDYIEALTLDIKSIKPITTPDDPETPDVDETVYGSETNIDKMLRPRMPGFDFDNFETVILKATYNVSADAKGKIESQLFDSTNAAWQNLYVIDADASTVEGAPFTKGEDFVVTTVIHSDGYVQVYLNNVLVKNANVVQTNGINGGEWSVAKVQNGCAEYAGQVKMTNISIDTEYAAEKSANGLYLYDQENMVTFSGDVLSKVDAASIRLFAPTGLRFATQIDMDALAPVVSNNIKIGTLIAPVEYVEAAGAFTREALAELNYVTSYIDVAAEINNLYQGNGSSAALPEGDYFTASIVNILEGNIDRDFAAIGYIEYSVGDQTITYYCSDYTVANVQAIAAAAQADFADTEYASIINAYAAGQQPKY
ncbi:MAG: hypothetical protein IJX80_05625 [Clostridia bacterium]|nr:hypothetical protein [Clostridia bacterium]